MNPLDTLHDRLADAADAAHPPVPDATAVRRSAVRHRTQRRVLGGSAVLVAVAAVAVAGSTLLAPRTTSIAPATPSPTATAAPTQDPSPEPSSPTAAATPP